MTLTSDKEARNFLADYCEFGPNRLYIFTAMARPKENEQISHGSIPIFREIITDESKIHQKYHKIKSLADNYLPEEGGELDYRLYLSANARNSEKAMHRFQKQLTDMRQELANGHEPTRKKIKRLDKEWLSTLLKSENKADKYFIIDIDSQDMDLYDRTIESLQENTEIIHAIESPNGFHVITRPFGYPNWEAQSWDAEIEIKTDGLTFLRMI